MLVTMYAGTKTVKVYADAGGDSEDSTRLGRISIGVGTDGARNTADDTYATLTKVGTYYQAGGGPDDTADGLTHEDVVGAEAKGETVYTYEDETDATVYVVEDMALRSTLGTGTDAVTTYTYTLVDITAPSLPDGDDVDTDPEVGQVTAKIPAASAYKHIHFGVWASLGDAAKDGSQDIADLGIGFVQNHDDSGETDNVPLQGVATYRGDWVATVQADDEDGDGAIVLAHDSAMIMADFEDDEITVDLENLATFKGDIAGSTFGNEDATATDISGLYGLDASGDFEGSFSGAFYGSKAAELGGLFDYSSDDMEEGAFRGAFGGDKK
jgi:hypothetical protein